MFGGSTADPGPASNGDKKPVDPKRNICGSWKNLDVRDFGSFSSGGVVRPMTSDERYALTIDLSKLPLDNLRDIINTFGLKETGLTGDGEIDVDKLGDDTLWRIQDYIRHTMIEYDGCRFLIMDSPKNLNLETYILMFSRYNVKHVVRTCDAIYSKEKVDAAGIEDLKYEDGEVPPSHLLREWLALVKKVFKNEKTADQTIAVHCMAGLGRAPALVAIAFLELGMDKYECVEFIRSKRHGAINKKQLDFLLSYKPTKSKSFIHGIKRFFAS